MPAGTDVLTWWGHLAHAEVADDLPLTIDLPHEEMYGEVFDIPAPDELVFISWLGAGRPIRLVRPLAVGRDQRLIEHLCRTWLGD